jgi:hypothetical protein
VYDRKFSKIFLFRQDGAFIRQIGKKGEGPEEYSSLTDMFWDESSELIFAHDKLKSATFAYNLEGQLVRRIKPRFQFNSFYKTGEGFWLYTCFKDNNPKGYNLMLVDETMQNMVAGFFPQNSNFINVEFRSMFYPDSEGNPYFSYPTSNNIYRLNAREPEILYKIDFGNKTAPYDKISKMGTHEEYVQLMGNNYLMLGKCFIWNHILIFSFSESALNEDHVSYRGFYDFENSTINIYKGFNMSKFIPVSNITATSGKALIFHKFPYELQSEELEFIETRINKKLNDESNPVLIICYPET